jgi:hypothetical protein
VWSREEEVLFKGSCLLTLNKEEEQEENEDDEEVLSKGQQ